MSKTQSILVRALSLAALCACGTASAQVVATTDTQNKVPVTVTTDAAAKLAKVSYSGTITISTRLSKDPDFGNDRLVILVDMKGTGVTRAGKTFSAAAQEVFEKPNGPSQRLEFTFPVTTGTETTLAQVGLGLAKIALNVDTATGKVTSASAILGQAQ